MSATASYPSSYSSHQQSIFRALIERKPIDGNFQLSTARRVNLEEAKALARAQQSQAAGAAASSAEVDYKAYLTHSCISKVLFSDFFYKAKSVVELESSVEGMTRLSQEQCIVLDEIMGEKILLDELNTSACFQDIAHSLIHRIKQAGVAGTLAYLGGHELSMRMQSRPPSRNLSPLVLNIFIPLECYQQSYERQELSPNLEGLSASAQTYFDSCSDSINRVLLEMLSDYTGREARDCVSLLSERFKRFFHEKGGVSIFEFGKMRKVQFKVFYLPSLTLQTPYGVELAMYEYKEMNPILQADSFAVTLEHLSSDLPEPLTRLVCLDRDLSAAQTMSIDRVAYDPENSPFTFKELMLQISSGGFIHSKSSLKSHMTSYFSHLRQQLESGQTRELEKWDLTKASDLIAFINLYYLSSSLILGSEGIDSRCLLKHPQIDRVLLQQLFASSPECVEERERWRALSLRFCYYFLLSHTTSLKEHNMLAASFNGLNFKVYLQPSGFEYTESMASLYSEFKRAGSRSLQLASHISDFLNRVLAINEANHLTIDYIAICRSIKHVFSIKDPESGNCLNHLLARLALINHALFTSDSSVLKDASMPFLEFNLNRVPLPRSSRVLSKQEIDHWFKKPSERLCFCLKELSTMGVRDESLHLLREALVLHQSEFASVNYFPFLGFKALYGLAENQESTLEDFFKAFKTSLEEFALLEDVMGVSAIPLYRAMLVPVLSFFSPFAGTVAPRLYFLNLSFSEGAFFRHKSYKDSLIAWSEVVLAKESCDSRSFFEKLYTTSGAGLALRMRFYSSCLSKEFHHLALTNMLSLKQELNTKRKGLAMLTESERLLLKETFQEMFARGFSTIDKGRFQEYLSALCYFLPALEFERETLLDFYKYLEAYQPPGSLALENFMELKLKVAQKLFRLTKTPSRLELISLFSKSKDEQIKAIAKEKLMLEDPENFATDQLLLLEQLYKDLKIDEERAFSIVYALCMKSLGKADKLDRATEALCTNMIEELVHKGNLGKALELSSAYVQKQAPISEEFFYLLFDAAVVKRDLSPQELESLLSIFECVHESNPSLSRKESIKDTIFELWFENSLNTKRTTFVMALLSESLSSSKDDTKSLFYLNCLLSVKAEMIEANLAVIYSYLTLLERSLLSSTKVLPKVPLKRALLQVYFRHETSVFLHLEKKEVAKLLKQMMGICFELGESGDIEYVKGKYVTEFLEYVAENSEANLDDQLDHFNYLASSMSSSVESLASYLSKLALLMPDSTERASLPSKFWDEVSIYFIESTPLFHSHLELIDQLSICFWPFSNRVKTSRGVDFLSQHLMPYPDCIARLIEVDSSQALASLDTLAPWFFQLEFNDEIHRKEQFHLLFEWLKTKREEGSGLLLFKELAFQRFIKDHQLITTQEQLSFVFDELQQVFTTTSEEDLFRVANILKELLNSENVVAVLNQKSGEAEKLNGQLARLVSLNYQLFYDYRSTNLKNGEEAALSYINILFSELNFFVSLSFQLDRRKPLQSSSREFFSSIFIYVKELESKQDLPFSTASPSSVIRDALSRVSENESMSVFYFNKNSFSLLKQGACFFCTMDSLDHQGYKIFSLHLATLLKDKKEFHASVTLYLKRVSNYLSLTLTNEWTEVLNTSFQSEISDLKALLNGKLAFRLSESCLSKFMYALQDCSLTLAPENQGVLTPAFDLCFNVLKPSLVDCLKNSADHEFNHMSFSLASRSFLEHGCCSLSFCNQLLALQHDSTTLLDQSLDLFEQAIERADNLDRKAKVLIEELSFLPSLLIQDKERYLEEAVRIEDIIVLLLNLYEDPEASEELKNSLAVAWGDYYSVLIESWGVAEAFSCSTITLGEYESVINELTQLISIERRYEKIKQKESCIVTTFLQEVIKFSNDDEGAIEALLLLYNFFDLDLSVGFRKALVDMVHSYFSHEGNTLEHIEEISLCHSTGEEPAGINHNGVCVISALKFLVDSSVSASLDKEAFKEAALLYFNKMKPSSIWSNAAVFEIELEFRMSLAKAAIAFQDDLKDFVTQDDGELRYFIHIFYEQAIVYFDLKTTVDNEAARSLTEDEKLFLRELIITVGKEELINYSLSANKLLFTRALASYADFGVFSAEDYIVIANTILREKGPGGVILVVEGLHQLIPSEVICCKVLAEEYDCSLFILLDSVFATVRNRLVNDKLSDEEAKKASELLTLAPIRYYLAALIRKKTDNIFALNLEYIISYLFFFYLIPKPVEADLLLAKLIKSQIYLPTRVQAPEGREMSLQALGGEIFADKCSDKETPYKKSQRLVSAMSGNKPSLLGEMIEAIRLAGGECKKEVEKKSDSVARERLSPDPDKESQESVSVQAIPEALLKIERPVELILWCELAFLWISAAAESTLCFEEYAVLSQLGGLSADVVLDNRRLRGYNAALDLGIKATIVRDLEIYGSRVLHFARTPLRTELNCLASIDAATYRDDVKEGESDLVRSHILKIETIMRDLASQIDPLTKRVIMSTDIYLSEDSSVKGSAYTYSLQECYARYFHLLALYADAKEIVLSKDSASGLSYFTSIQVFAFRWQSVAKAVKGQGFVPLVFYTDGLCRKEQMYLVAETQKAADEGRELDSLAKQRAKGMTYDYLDRVLQEYHVKKEILKLNMEQEYKADQLLLKMAPFIVKACESMLFDPHVVHCLERTSRSFVVFATWIGYICTRILPKCSLPNPDFERGIDLLFFSPIVKIFKKFLNEFSDAEGTLPESKLFITRCLQTFFLPYVRDAVEACKSEAGIDQLPSYLLKVIEYGDEFFTIEFNLDAIDESLIDSATDIREAQAAYADLKASICQVT